MTQVTPAEPRTTAGARPFFEDSAVSKDGTTIGYRSIGSGPGVVLLHGAMESSVSHTQLALALADAFTVHLPDRRGRGLSGPYAAPYRIQDDIDDMAAVLAKTGAQLVFGVSSGALIWLHAARALPAIRKAVIFEPPLLVGAGSLALMKRFDEEITHGKVTAALVTGMMPAVRDGADDERDARQRGQEGRARRCDGAQARAPDALRLPARR